MLGTFQYCNPTKLYFGRDTLTYLNQELPKYRPQGTTSLWRRFHQKSGLYDQVLAILKSNGKNRTRGRGRNAQPNHRKTLRRLPHRKRKRCRPDLSRRRRLRLRLRQSGLCFRLVPGGPLDKYYLRMEDVDNRIIPVGCVLTLAGTGSEMNGGAVITNPASKLKIGHVFGENVFPNSPS